MTSYSGRNSNPGGPGGRRQRIKASSGGGGGKKKDCCPMVAAVRSVKRGKFRLAGRYARLSLRIMGARLV